jgi:hypothetical protein
LLYVLFVILLLHVTSHTNLNLTKTCIPHLRKHTGSLSKQVALVYPRTKVELSIVHAYVNRSASTFSEGSGESTKNLRYQRNNQNP